MQNTSKIKIGLCIAGLVFVFLTGLFKVLSYNIGMCLAAFCLAACLILDCYSLYKEKRMVKMVFCITLAILIIIASIFILSINK